MFSKFSIKKSIYSISILLIGLVGYFFIKNFNSSTPVTTIKSPCRGFIDKKINSQKKIIISKRIDQLNALMELPIDWIFKDIKGEVIDLYCYRDQKKILINLWATWCASCIEEMSSLSQLADTTISDLLVVAITTEPLKEVQTFIDNSFSDLSNHFKIVSVSSMELDQYFFQDSIPTTYIFSKKGLLENKILGSKDWLKINI